MVVRKCVVVEECNVNQVISREAACNEGIGEDINGHGVVIKSKKLIEPDLLLLDLPPFSLLLSEDSHPKFAVIHKAASELLTSRVLNTLFDLDVAFIISNFFFKGQLLSLDTKLRNIGSLVILLGDNHSPLRIIGDQHVLDWKPGHHRVLLQQILENVTILHEPRVGLDLSDVSLRIFVSNGTCLFNFILTIGIVIIKSDTPSAGIFLFDSCLYHSGAIFDEHRLLGLETGVRGSRLCNLDSLPMGSG